MPKLNRSNVHVSCGVCARPEVPLFKYGVCELCYDAIYRLLAVLNARVLESEASALAASVPLGIPSIESRVECYLRDVRSRS